MFITFVAIWHAGLVVAVVANCLALFFAAIIALATIGRSARQEFAVVASQSHAHPPAHPVVELPPIVTPAFIATCASVLVMQLLSYVIVQSDQLVGGLSIAATNSAFSLEDSALYGTARRVVLLIALPMDLLNLTIAATIPRLYARRDILGLQALLRRTTRLAGLPTMVALLAIFAAPRLFLEIYFGAKYGAAATLVVILSLGVLVQSWCGACEIVLVMTGHQGIVLRINAFLATGFVVCAYLAALKFGAVGLAIVAAVTLISQRLLLWYFAHRAVGVWTNFSLPWRFADLRATFRRTN
jgi:O-antigen/teichoic acid export membrane protein